MIVMLKAKRDGMDGQVVFLSAFSTQLCVIMCVTLSFASVCVCVEFIAFVWSPLFPHFCSLPYGSKMEKNKKGMKQ